MSEFEDQAAKAAQEEEENKMLEDMFKKKKKKVVKKKTTDKDKADKGEGGGDGAGEDDGAQTAGEKASVFELDPPTYSYNDLLDRVTNFIHENNPELTDKKKFTLKPPQLMRVGTKKSLWVNFQEICGMMRRNPDHVFQFMMAELGTEGSIDGNKRLVIRGKFQPKYIESLLRKYVVEYVSCNMCRSLNTLLTRDNVSRLFFVSCQDCGSSRSVAQIRAGFHAQTRADRKAMRSGT